MKKGIVIAVIVLIVLYFTSRTIFAETVKKVDFHLDENETVISFLDFSNGEATLIQGGNGKTVLINTGGQGTSKELEKHFQLYDIKKIDLLILTHQEKHYTGNLQWLVKQHEIKEIAASSPLVNRLEQDEKLTSIDKTVWGKGDLKEILPGMIIKVLYSQPQLPKKAQTNSEVSKPSSDKEDSYGLILSIIYGKNHILYMGTSSSEIEQSLIDDNGPLAADIIKIPEFGNAATEPFFLKEVDPHAAIIFTKEHAIPDQDIIERLYETWIDVYHTRQFGNISIKCDPETYEIITLPIKEHQERAE